jgi:small redox-active disulfide protein 2
MKRIQVLGPGCKRCSTLVENVRTAVEELGLAVEIEKVTDVATIASMGVLMTPGLAIDGKVESAGHLLSVGQVKRILDRTRA